MKIQEMAWRTQINYKLSRRVLTVFMFDQLKHFYLLFIQLQRYLDASVRIRDFLERQEFYHYCHVYVGFLHEYEWNRHDICLALSNAHSFSYFGYLNIF